MMREYILTAVLSDMGDYRDLSAFLESIQALDWDAVFSEPVLLDNVGVMVCEHLETTFREIFPKYLKSLQIRLDPNRRLTAEQYDELIERFMNDVEFSPNYSASTIFIGLTNFVFEPMPFGVSPLSFLDVFISWVEHAIKTLDE